MNDSYFVQQQRQNKPMGNKTIDQNIPQKVQWLLRNTPVRQEGPNARESCIL